MVYVFKTSVKTKKAIKELAPKLNRFVPNLKWNFDLEDCDKILFLETETEITIQPVIKLLQEKGFDCEELVD